MLRKIYDEMSSIQNMVYDFFANPWAVQKNLFWGKWLIIPKQVYYIA